jgi:hypothetical protein
MTRCQRQVQVESLRSFLPILLAFFATSSLYCVVLYFTASLKLRFYDSSNGRYGSKVYSVSHLLYLLLHLVYLLYLRTQRQKRVESLAHVIAHLSENRDMSNLSNHR